MDWKIIEEFNIQDFKVIRMDSILFEATDSYFRWSGLKKNTNIRITSKEIDHEEFLKN